MVMEYWSGWFDVWGEHHHVFHAEGTETLLDHSLSPFISDLSWISSITHHSARGVTRNHKTHGGEFRTEFPVNLSCSAFKRNKRSVAAELNTPSCDMS